MQYEPLDMTKNEIRVLEFLDLPSPVSTEGIIRCSIRNVSLGTPRQSYFRGRKLPSIWDKYTKSVDSRHLTLEQTTHAGLHGTPGSGSRYDWGDFEALSYTWGDTSETKTIQINGVHKDVPRNLEEALRALRNLEETLSGMCYWIDSLCIDQENIEERNEQVKRMKEIYGRARAVIVWLGQEEEQDGIAVQIMQQLCNGAEGKYPRNDMVRREWPAIIPFAQKPYWSRCWIIQELAMNHNATLFLCGEFELTRKMIESGARWGLRLSQDSEDINHQSDHKLQLGAWAMVTHMDNLIAIEHKGNYRMGVDSLLHLIRRAGATDEKDKIYSILGLLDPAISAGVTPDYSLSVQQVYTEFMKSAINGSGILDQVVFAAVKQKE
ncbi:uncharacterized protein J4E79_009811 [Alternaria viburni]|uniref:uncharacterized protein n=1 Tax=Alternaria viburni TaxID=566460 RepID=UPI0020C4036F|nr:uncharacterized protein J4E79_009811 [Alternaria viburni]KAI4648740.1 hypothetical protein J4E79_009811 [Alternaria viburni]